MRVRATNTNRARTSPAGGGWPGAPSAGLPPVAVMSDMPGIEVRISARRSNACSSPSRRRIPARMSASRRSICLSFCLVIRPCPQACASACRGWWWRSGPCVARRGSAGARQGRATLPISRPSDPDLRWPTRHDARHPGVHRVGLAAPSDQAGEGPDLRGDGEAGVGLAGQLPGLGDDAARCCGGQLPSSLESPASLAPERCPNTIVHIAPMRTGVPPLPARNDVHSGRTVGRGAPM